MTVEHAAHDLDTHSGRNIGQADKAGVRSVATMDQLPKVLVDRDENATFSDRPSQQFFVAWVGASYPGFNDIVPLRAPPIRQAPTSATIDQKFHPAATSMASSLSPATIA